MSKRIRPASRPFFGSSRFLASLLVVVTCAIMAAAQSQVPKRGSNPNGAYALGEIESISTSNGNLTLRVPIASLPAGRAGLSASVGLYYNSKLYDTSSTVIYPLGSPVSVDQVINSPHGGWRYGFDYKLHLMIREDRAFHDCPDPLANPHMKLLVSFPDGSTHEFRPSGFPANGPSYLPNGDGYFPIRPDGFGWDCSGGSFVVTTGMHYYSTDGSYMRLDVEYDGDPDWQNNNWALALPDGSRVTGRNNARQFYDRNANEIRFRNITLDNGNEATRIFDFPMGRDIVIEYTQAGTDLVHYNGTNGDELTYAISFSEIRAGTYSSFGSDGVTYQFGMPFVTVVDSVTLPSQGGALSFAFGYNNLTTFCEVKSMTLPSGARVDYAYQNGGNASLIEQVTENHVTTKDLTYNREYDGSSTPTTEHWNYNIPPLSGGEAIITAPDGGKSHEWSYGGGFNNPLTEWKAGLIYRAERPDGAVVERIWAANVPYNALGTGLMNPYMKTEFTSIKDAIGNLTKTAIRDFKYDKNGNVTQLVEYDWMDYSLIPRDGTNFPTGVPQNAAPKRVAVRAYVSSTPDSLNSSTYDPDAYQETGSPAVRGALDWNEGRSGFSDTLAVSRTEFFYDNPLTTANLIEQKSWDSNKGGVSRPISRPLSGNNSVSIHNEYDAYGNVVVAIDPRGYKTQSTYGDVNGYPGLYVTQIKTAWETGLERTATAQYDFYTGQPTLATDVDNGVSTRTSYDAVGRPILLQEGYQSAIERRTATEYSGTARRVIVRSDLNATGDGKLVTIQHYDQMGRVRLSRQLEDAASQSATDETSGIKVQTRYGFSGSNMYELVSNPYRAATSASATAEPAMGWTRNKYDRASRLIEVQTFSGASLPAPFGSNSSTTGSVITSYDRNYTTVIDQAGKQRRMTVDACGRLVRVDEPDSSNNLGDPDNPVQKTEYLYDTLDNVTGVTQGVQPPRMFTYSSLSRLLSAQNPESGTVSYRYDNNGNLDRKTDARGVVTSYEYDALNRIISRSYTTPGGVATTPTVTYSYDSPLVPFSKGQLTRVSSSASTYDYLEYDELGQIKQAKQTTSGVEYPMSFTWDRAGNLVSQTYPSGRVVTNSRDAAGRLSSISGQKNAVTTNYASGMAYLAHGGIIAMSLANGTMTEQASYNSRFQQIGIELRKVAGNQLLLGLDCTYSTAGQADNNENLRSEVIRIGAAGGGTTTISQNYTYDELNRLKTATETGAWSQTFSYDRWGNRTSVVNTGSLPSPFNGPIDGATNRITQFGYDLSGNVTNDGVGNQYTFDGDNLQRSHSPTGGGSTGYQYDGGGHRVMKVAPDSSTTVFVYNVLGEMVAEYRSPASPPPPQGGTSYLTTDSRGNTRVVTGADGSVRGRHDYLPFGEELPSTTGARANLPAYVLVDRVRQKFSQNERDEESGLDYFEARYYSAYHGRFASPDPLLGSGTATQPQGWNRYSYTINNPLKYTDSDGMDWWYHPKHLPFEPVWFVHDPGAPWKRWADSFGYVFMVTTGKDAGKWVVLNPMANEYYVLGSQAEAESKFKSFNVGGLLPLIKVSLADRDFWAGFSAGIAPVPFVYLGVDWLDFVYSVKGVDTTSRDYQAGVLVGILTSIGINVAVETVAAIRSMNVKAIKEGIYEFKDLKNGGLTYVGQSEDIDRRLAEHIRAGRLDPNELANVKRTEVLPGKLGGKVTREIAEQRRIDQLGGIGGGRVSNKRNPIGPKRRHLMLWKKYEELLDRRREIWAKVRADRAMECGNDRAYSGA